MAWLKDRAHNATEDHFCGGLDCSGKVAFSGHKWQHRLKLLASIN